MAGKFKKCIFSHKIFLAFFVLEFLCILFDAFQIASKWIPRLVGGNDGGYWKGIINFLCLLVPNNLESSSNVFFAVWGVAIAVAIFLVEISGSYHCGISLKHVTRWFWKK